MKTSMVKGLCLAVALFGMVITSVSAQVLMTTSSLLDRDFVCANPSTIYPNADVAGAAEFPIPFQTVSRPSVDGSVDIQVLHDDYKSLGPDSNIKVIDWVQIELRVANSGAAVPARITDIEGATVARVAGLLLANGEVVDPDQTAGEAITEGISIEPPEDLDMDAQDVYVIVAHRNHIPIMSAQAQNSAIENEELIDFTDSPDVVVGGTAAVKEEVVGGQTVYAMIAGDANLNGQTQASDGSNIIAPIFGNATYHNADVNMDGEIQAVDIANTLAPNFGRGIQFGTNFNADVDTRLTSSDSARPASRQQNQVACLQTSG